MTITQDLDSQGSLRNEFPIIQDLSTELDGFGLFLPVMTGIVDVQDLDSVTGVASNANDLAVDASGFAQIAMFLLPEEAFTVVPEPATWLLLSVGILGIVGITLGRSWQQRKRLGVRS